MPRVVNQVHQPRASLASGDLPDWDLGINLPLPDPDATEPALLDLLVLVEFLAHLREKIGHDFVLGLANSSSSVAEDCLFVTDRSPTRDQLRALL